MPIAVFLAILAAILSTTVAILVQRRPYSRQMQNVLWVLLALGIVAFVVALVWGTNLM